MCTFRNVRFLYKIGFHVLCNDISQASIVSEVSIYDLCVNFLNCFHNTVSEWQRIRGAPSHDYVIDFYLDVLLYLILFIRYIHIINVFSKVLYKTYIFNLFLFFSPCLNSMLPHLLLHCFCYQELFSRLTS